MRKFGTHACVLACATLLFTAASPTPRDGRTKATTFLRYHRPPRIGLACNQYQLSSTCSMTSKWLSRSSLLITSNMSTVVPAGPSSPYRPAASLRSLEEGEIAPSSPLPTEIGRSMDELDRLLNLAPTARLDEILNQSWPQEIPSPSSAGSDVFIEIEGLADQPAPRRGANSAPPATSITPSAHLAPPCRLVEKCFAAQSAGREAANSDGTVDRAGLSASERG